VLRGTLIFERAPGESVGTYLITPSGATSGNYAINFTGNTLTITPRDLIVTASSKTKTYGAALTLNGAVDFSTAGLQNGETIGSVTLTASDSPPGTAATAAAGSYTISPSEATGGTINPANYSITYATGALTVNPTPISVTADAKTKTFGTVDPAFTVTYSGFVNGETSAVLGGSLQFTRAPGEGVGSYLITPSGLTSGNYLITYNSGTLTITAPAPQMLPVAFTGSNVIISWNAVSNVTYRVQYKTNLLATSWNDLSPDVIANAVTASKTDILTTTRFYRVQVLP
jgi:hypothetical protein